MNYTESHLNKALIQPTDKLSVYYNKKLLPSGRFMRDYVLKPSKYFGWLHSIGFTLNIEHVKGNQVILSH